jgi:hypothetical protein
VLDLVQLVRHEHHCGTGAGELADRLQQSIRLGVGQDCGWLIEDQDPRTADQHFHDLDLLLLRDRERRSAARVDIKPSSLAGRSHYLVPERKWGD